MSQQIVHGRDPETITHTIVKLGNNDVELVMPPMDEEAKLAKLYSLVRCFYLS